MFCKRLTAPGCEPEYCLFRKFEDSIVGVCRPCADRHLPHAVRQLARTIPRALELVIRDVW